MDPKLESEILKTCESIGFADEDEKYIADPEWELCVKDLLLYLRKDDDDHTVRRLLGRNRVLERDIIPLLRHNHKDPRTWDITLRLLANLTHPALLLYEEEVPKNKTYLNYYHQLEAHLRSYKAAFVNNDFWKILAEKVSKVFEVDLEKRKDHDKIIVERIFILIRNVLHVPADPAEERRADDDTSLHDRFLMVLHLSGIFELLLHTASSDSSHEYSILLLEIMSLMFREQTGEQLAKTQWTRNEEDKIRDERELVRMREKEKVLKSIQLGKLPTRHSRFGGTYVIQDMKSGSGRDILCHKPITSVADLSLDSMKKRKKVASNRKPAIDSEITRRSTIPVRIILKNFCASFLEGKYNRLMNTVKDYINRSRGEDNDETYYLWGLKFFMEFNRYHEFKLSKVSDTMSTNTFHYVQTLLDKYEGMMVTEKEKIALWSKRAHIALKAYQELLFTLLWMDKQGEDERAMDKSRAIKGSVFYLPEYRELLHGLLNTYDPQKLSKSYLKDLIETNHLFLKMLEDYASSSRRIIIKVKGRKKKSKKEKKQAAKKITKVKPLRGEELEDAWSKMSDNLLVELSKSNPNEGGEGDEETNSTTENVIPFDAASDTPIDEQKDTAVERIAAFLHTEKLKEAVILLRACREVWPTDPDYFGELGCTDADEQELLRTIYVEKASINKVLEARAAVQNAALDDKVDEVPRAPMDEDEHERAAVIGDETDDDERDEEDEEEEEEMEQDNAKEQEFDFKGFVLKYASARVVCNYALLFQDWDSLKPLTLHCILKMFHRFVFDMGYPALMCQASLFLTWKKILEVADHRSDLKEAKGFFSHFWPKFVKLCNDKKMFVEILFWKTAREAQEIQDGYSDLRGDGGGKKKKSDWTKDEENELELLVDLYKDSPEEVKKAQKLLDFIMERWTWRSRAKRAFQNKLVEKGLADASELFSKKSKRPPKTWNEEEISKLRELFEAHKDSDDVMGSLLPQMILQRSKKSVIEKMIEIGLIRDKREVKKRGKRSKKSKSRSQVLADSDSETEREGPRESVIERGSRSDSDSGSSDSESEREANDSSDEDTGVNSAPSSAGVGPFDEEKICKIGKELMKKDMSAAVRWACQSLKYFLEDIMEDPDSDESVPLVPIGKDCILAISDSDFKMFLKSLGINPPGQQETYWRIPSYFKKKDVDMRIETLEKILTDKEENSDAVNNSDGVSTANISRAQTPTSHPNDCDEPSDKSSKLPSRVDSDSDPELPDIEPKTRDYDSESRASSSQSSQSSSSSSSSQASESTLSSQMSKSTLSSQISKATAPSQKSKSGKKSRIIRDESDSDSDSNLSKTVRNDDGASSIVSDFNPTSTKSKRAIIDDSDEDSNPQSKEKSTLIANDDDAESTISDHSTVTRKVAKRKRIVLEDSDDESNVGVSNQRNKKMVRSSAAIIDSDSD